MKKLRKVLLTLILAVGLVLPMNVHAANVANSSDINFKNKGKIKAGQATWEYTDKENGIKEWTFVFTASKDLTGYIALKLVPTNVTVQKISTGSDKLILASNSNSADVLIKLAETGIKSGEEVVMLKVTTKDVDTAIKDCKLDIMPLSLDCSTTINGMLFDNEGNAITKEKYDEVCAGVTPDPTPDDNPNTGSAVPYVAITGGLLAIAGVYFYSKKSKKMYHI